MHLASRHLSGVSVFIICFYIDWKGWGGGRGFFCIPGVSWSGICCRLLGATSWLDMPSSLLCLFISHISFGVYVFVVIFSYPSFSGGGAGGLLWHGIAVYGKLYSGVSIISGAKRYVWV